MATDTKKKALYWLETAHYDLVSAKAMLQTRRYLYVGFLCHQVAEKSLKAYYWHRCKKETPFIHNLLVLSESSGFDSQARPDHLCLFNELMPLNIQARYPEDKELLLKSLNRKKCEELYSRTRGIYSWIKKLLA